MNITKMPKIGDTVYSLDGVKATVADGSGLNLFESYVLVELESGQQTTWSINKVYDYDPCELLLLTLRNHSKNRTLSTYATACAAVTEHMAMHLSKQEYQERMTLTLNIGRHLRIVLTALQALARKEGFPDGNF